ncbi:MAG: DUF2157 domain-containing protein [Acidobacteriaceae bacterium]
MAAWEEYLDRWTRAGVMDASAADRVRAFERQAEAPAKHNWQIGILLSFGIILLVGGMMLFVASHWDDVSPWQRLALVLGFLASFHAFGAASAKKFPGMGSTLHGVGTAGAGAAILTVGTIFNMQEHWPTAVLVWAACAGAGWWLLRDQVQEAMTLLLVPAWVICEWSYRAEGYAHGGVYVARMCAVFAAVMLTCFLRSRKQGVFWTLYVVGVIGVMSPIVVLSDGWSSFGPSTVMVPVGLRVLCAVVVAATLAAVWWQSRSGTVPVALVAAVVYVLPWLPKDVVYKSEYGLQAWAHVGPGLLTYGVVAIGCAVLVWWGLRMRSRAVVNFGIGGFAATVLWFYVSSLLDKLGRAMGLIGLGMLFLAGGWALERLRRHLVAELREDTA